jgi:hypothetical protein
VIFPTFSVCFRQTEKVGKIIALCASYYISLLYVQVIISLLYVQVIISLLYMQVITYHCFMCKLLCHRFVCKLLHSIVLCASYYISLLYVQVITYHCFMCKLLHIIALYASDTLTIKYWFPWRNFKLYKAQRGSALQSGCFNFGAPLGLVKFKITPWRILGPYLVELKHFIKKLSTNIFF